MCPREHQTRYTQRVAFEPCQSCIRWSEANARRNKVFLANVPWVARHLDSKTHLTTKEEDVWEDCHDAGLLSWAVVYGDILHGTRSFNNVAQYFPKGHGLCSVQAVCAHLVQHMSGLPHVLCQGSKTVW